MQNKGSSSARRKVRRSAAAVDLFCGVGGLTHGLQTAGINVVSGIDIDPDCQFAYETNNRARFVGADVSNLGFEAIADQFPSDSTRLLVGCAPCQPFSKYSGGRSRQDKTAPIGRFASIVAALQPAVVSMENVAAVSRSKSFSGFLSTLKMNQYEVEWGIVDTSMYGVPQRRKRLILLASRLGPISLPQPTTHTCPPTVRRTLKGLPSLAAGQADSSDPLHRASDLTEINLRRIRASTPGGTWRDWPNDLRAECHRSSSGMTFPAVYGRMEWDQPGPTMTTQYFGYGNGRFGHPEEDRALSLREGALLQTFPHTYQFERKNDRRPFTEIGRHVGNAVPVALAFAIGKTIARHIEETDE